MLGERAFRRITDNAWNADVRLAAMDRCGVDRQVLSPTPVFFAYDQPADAAAGTAAIFNDLALEIAAQAPHRLVPFCQVPLQDTDAACRELDRAVAAGHRGVEIGNHVGDRDLDDAGIVTFLQHCAARDVPVFVHPWDMPTRPAARRWMAQWLTGMPAETHLSILAMVLGGVFDQVDAACGSASRTAAARSRSGSGASRTPGTGATTSSARRRSAARVRRPVQRRLRRVRRGALRLLVDTLGADPCCWAATTRIRSAKRTAGDADPHLAAAQRRRTGKLLAENAAAFLGRMRVGHRHDRCRGPSEAGARYLDATDPAPARRGDFLVPPAPAGRSPRPPTSRATRWACSRAPCARSSTRSCGRGPSWASRGTSRASGRGSPTTRSCASRWPGWSARSPRRPSR